MYRVCMYITRICIEYELANLKLCHLYAYIYAKDLYMYIYICERFIHVCEKCIYVCIRPLHIYVYVKNVCP